MKTIIPLAMLITLLPIPALAETNVIDATEYSYNAANRRDPFAQEKQDTKVAAPGITGMAIDAIDLQGIVISPDGKERYAIVMGTDNKGYTLQVGSTLRDGRVQRIERDRVIFLKKSSDPLNPQPFEERIKPLNPED